MGKSTTAKRAARDVKKPITPSEFQITSIELAVRRSFFCRAFGERRIFSLIFWALLIGTAIFGGASNSLAQNFDELSVQIRRGNTEQKREALRIIRNAESAEASRAAIPALRDAAEIVRATAAFSVIFLPPDEAFRALSPLLSDKKELVRREAAYALGKVGNPLAVNLLIERFQKDKVAEVKNASIVAVGEIGDAAAIDFLTNILRAQPKNEDEADDFRRRAAARSIGQIAQIIQIGITEITTPENSLPEDSVIYQTPRFPFLAEQFPAFRPAIPVLINVLQNRRETNDARREAAFALGAIGDAAAISVLQTHLTDEDYYLAAISRQSLRKIAFYSNQKISSQVVRRLNK